VIKAISMEKKGSGWRGRCYCS